MEIKITHFLTLLAFCSCFPTVLALIDLTLFFAILSSIEYHSFHSKSASVLRTLSYRRCTGPAWNQWTTWIVLSCDNGSNSRYWFYRICSTGIYTHLSWQAFRIKRRDSHLWCIEDKFFKNRGFMESRSILVFRSLILSLVPSIQCHRFLFPIVPKRPVFH